MRVAASAKVFLPAVVHARAPQVTAPVDLWAPHPSRLSPVFAERLRGPSLAVEPANRRVFRDLLVERVAGDLDEAHASAA